MRPALPGAERRPRGAAGFVLVGAVMLVLALTILGLSLFSLSSYESQFLRQSVEDLQTFQVASGAIERAKYALAVTSELAAVQTGLPDHVLATVAIQEKAGGADSLGAVEWGGEPVRIRVQVDYRGRRRSMEGEFTPTQGVHTYMRLVTAWENLEVLEPARYAHMELTGRIRIGPSPASDTTWNQIVPPGQRHIEVGSSDPPDFNDYWARAQAAGATLLPDDDTFAWSLGTGTGVSYYRSVVDPDDDTDQSSIYIPFRGDWPAGRVPPASIQVRGTVVWLLDRRWRALEHVTVHGSGGENNCLILVARQWEDNEYGLGFFHGLSSDIPVILVSESAVEILYTAYASGNTGVPELSMFARRVALMGPLNPVDRMILGPIGDEHLIDALADQGVLPGQTASTRRRLDLIAGTWRTTQP